MTTDGTAPQDGQPRDEPAPAEQVHQALETLQASIGEAVVGYRETLEELFIAFITGGHVLVEGVPGIAKTTMAKAMASGLDLTYNRVQFTQDVLPTDVTGHYFFNQKTSEFEFRKGPLFSNIILADEINRASAKTQSALLEAMQEQQITVEGDTYHLPSPYFVIATQNPVDVEGVYTLPVAQLDRFSLKLTMDYLPREQEREVLARTLSETLTEGLETGDGGIDPWLLRGAHRQVHVDETVGDYILDLVEATRRSPDLRLGASTRASIHLMQAARGRALLEGRDYVIPDDVKREAATVLRHRLAVTVDAELEDRSAVDILEEMLDDVEVPRERSEASP